MAKTKQPKKEEEVFVETIFESNIEDVMSEGFGRYSKYVLQERAVPDVRDGLKPVQRRILYTMILEGNVSSKQTRKCARTVGQVIGRFHPHGDTSVYDAMVRLSQDWKMRYPLIDFQGNNGSIDGDGPAAYRYTEARLSELSDLMVQDLNKKTVDMQLNFDDQEFEPVVLPSRFPNMLVNGTQGIAIGASTDIPPHNLCEVIDAINYRIQHKRCEVSDLMEFIQGPDFPTGGIIKNKKDLLNIYETGNGSFKLWCKTEVLTSDKNINQIIIHEIPWGKDKSELIQNIDKCRFTNKLDAILETRDETDKDGLRIALDIKKESDPNNILNFLLSKGVLCSTIKFNALVIDHNHPRVTNLLEMIDCYIEHQVEVITRRSQFDLDKAKSRLHIVDGLIKACSIIDEVVACIKASKDKADAKINLVNEFTFTEIQAEAILNLQLYRLTNLDITSLKNEQSELNDTIEYLEGLLSNPNKINNLIRNDLNKIKDKYGDSRRTTIVDEQITYEIDKKALISKETVMVSFTKDGYIKRSQLKSYRSSQDQVPNIKLGDCLKGVVEAETTDTLLLFTNFGNFIAVPVYKLVDKKWKDEGQHMNDITTLSPSEKIIGGICVKEFKDNIYVTMLSKLGQIKRTLLTEFDAIKTNKPSRCFRLSDGDELVTAEVTTGNSNILIISDNGSCAFYNENEVNIVGIKAGGIKAIKLDKDCSGVCGFVSFLPDERTKLIAITNHHGLRIVDSMNLDLGIRLGPKQAIFKTFKSDPQKCVYFKKIDKKFEDLSVYVAFENQDVLKYDLKDVKSMPLDSYLKSNMNVTQSFDITDVYSFEVQTIDSSIKALETKEYKKQEPKSVNIKKEEIKKTFKEDNNKEDKITLFDFVDDD